ncbi:hypothetical protein ACFU5Y_19945 [Streptomyces gardneri]|uniref:hypothetical protein n=1 Tax=Streptomyces gardneri TaxID=66892 RepID=UPI0036C0F0FD
MTSRKYATPAARTAAPPTETATVVDGADAPPKHQTDQTASATAQAAGRKTAARARLALLALPAFVVLGGLLDEPEEPGEPEEPDEPEELDDMDTTPGEGRPSPHPGFAARPRQRSASSGQTPMWSCSSSSATRCSIPSACV